MKDVSTRVLVAYETKLGSTAEVAQFIGSVLVESGLSATVLPISEVRDLAAFDMVIIGSAIRYDHWLPGAVDLVEQNRPVLSGKPVAFFFTCLTLAKPTAAAHRKAEGYADKLRALSPDVIPLTIGKFAGVLDFARTPWPARLALRLLSLATGVKQGDYRDWSAIRAWCEDLCESLGSDASKRGLSSTPKHALHM